MRIGLRVGKDVGWPVKGIEEGAVDDAWVIIGEGASDGCAEVEADGGIDGRADGETVGDAVVA